MKHRTIVVNKYKEPYDVLIMRGTKWGNPFKIGIDGDRTTVIKKYVKRLLKNKELLRAIPTELGGGKRLGCCCKPKPCHGDPLAYIANHGLAAFKEIHERY